MRVFRAPQIGLSIGHALAMLIAAGFEKRSNA
jgi:hypothetical protein